MSYRIIKDVQVTRGMLVCTCPSEEAAKECVDDMNAADGPSKPWPFVASNMDHVSNAEMDEVARSLGLDAQPTFWVLAPTGIEPVTLGPGLDEPVQEN